MYNDLTVSFDVLQQSVNKFNVITHLFLQRALLVSEKCADRFLEFKNNHAKDANKESLHTAVYNEHEQCELLAFRDSVKHRFVTCFGLTTSFLKRYLEESCGVTTETPEEVFQQCMAHDIITNDEAQNLIALSKDLQLFSFSQEPEVPQDVIQYGIVMHAILKRLN